MWIKFFGLWIFAMNIHMINRYYTVNISERMRGKIEKLMVSAEVDIEEPSTRQIELLLVLEMLGRTFLVRSFV